MTERNKSKLKFVNLHGHSCASVFDGLGYPSEHMDFAYENGLDAIALTDHGNMNNLPLQVFHAKKMEKDGREFKPIYGVEGYAFPDLQEWQDTYKQSKEKDDSDSAIVVETEERDIKSILKRRRHMVLLAKNQDGLNKLFEMITQSFEKPWHYYFPRIDYKTLKKFAGGDIIATSACLGGVYAGNMWENYDFELSKEENDAKVLNAMRETSEQMLDIFGEDWYGEIQWNNIPEQHLLNSYVIQICKEFNIKLVSTCDAHYPNPELFAAREMYKRLGWLRNKEDLEPLPEKIEDMGYQLWPKNGDQMLESFRNSTVHPDIKDYLAENDIEYDESMVIGSIEESYNIAHNKIESFYPDSTVKLPDFVVPENKTADEALSEMAFAALAEKGYDALPSYYDRLEKELAVISSRGFSKYFLTMKEVTDEAKQLYLCGPGRGSAAGSLLAYMLGITQVNPLRWNTQFERFLRSDATDYPDIDFDISHNSDFRDHLIEKWGKNTVVSISNINTMQLRSLVKDISKYYGIDFTEVNKVTSTMMQEATPRAKQKHGIKAGVYTPTYEEVKEFSESLQAFLRKYPKIEKFIDSLHGMPRSVSRHAGGVVIADNLNKHIPLINSKGTTQVPWTKDTLEPMGFIKFDLLGLDTLKMMHRAIANILRRYHNKTDITIDDITGYYNEKLHPDVIDLEDQKVYKNVYHDGKWAGVFQFTEQGAQNFCQVVKPTNIIELASITSIQRPGPLAAGVDEEYGEAKEYPHKIKFMNDIHAEVTAETYGFLIFQEQIAEMAHKLGKDISLDDGNKLRKALTKKNSEKSKKMKEELYDKFVDGCMEKGMTRKQAKETWQLFEYFSGYGFNKSHAVCYSLISFQTAWLLTYYPECWLAAFLNEESETKMEKAIAIVKKLGYNVKRPNINYSSDQWEISKDGSTLFQPLTDIDGVGDAAYKEILPHRPFELIEDLYYHKDIRWSKVNKTVIDRLCRSGALDDLIDDRFTGSKHFWSVLLSREKKKENFLELIENPEYREEGDFSDMERIAFLSDLTSVLPIDMIVDDEMLKHFDQLDIGPLSENQVGHKYSWCIPVSFRKRKTKKRGSPYYEIMVTDSTFQMSRVRVWNIRTARSEPQLYRPYIVKGVEYDTQWGFSTGWRAPFEKNWVIVG